MDRYAVKQYAAWGMVIGSMVLTFFTYPSKHSGVVHWPHLTDWIGIPVLILMVGGLFLVSYLNRSWLGAILVVTGLIVGLLVGSFREAKYNRYERNPHLEKAQQLLEERGLEHLTRGRNHNWNRHKLLAGVCFGGLLLGAAMIKNKV